MGRPVILDLFCGAGGASVGYYRAGFDVVGVDLEEQPRYPFDFIKADAVTFDTSGFRYIHASPPCQAYSVLQKRTGKDYPALISLVREKLKNSGASWVIENVSGAPLIDPIMLCGTMFDGLRVLRHRLFESNVQLHAPNHQGHPLVFTKDRRKGHYGILNQNTSYVQVTGGGNCTLKNARDAMGIDWMNKREINESIPPAYTEYVGRQLLGKWWSYEKARLVETV